jgi:hypothetical protein
VSRTRTLIMPLAAALGGLSAAAQAAPVPDGSGVSRPANAGRTGEPNTLVSTGHDLLGFVVSTQEDGTVVAQHASHASHASHHSHYSSR